MALERPSREELVRLYHTEGRSTYKIAKMYGINHTSVRDWLVKEGIPRRDKRRRAINAPPKEEIEKKYIEEKKSLVKIGEEYGVCSQTVSNWFKKYNISIVDLHLKRPPKKDLERLYRMEKRSTTDIGKIYGTGHTTVLGWFKYYSIKTRGISEATLLSINSNNIPAKELNKKRIGNASKLTNSNLKDYIEGEPHLVPLSYAAINLGGLRDQFEQIIMDLCNERFKSQKELHDSLDRNSEYIRELIGKGSSDLGIKIFPIIIQHAVDSIPDYKLTNSLEDKILKMLIVSYDPIFNHCDDFTLMELGIHARHHKGKKKTIYEKLLNHYREVQKIPEALRPKNTILET